MNTKVKYHVPSHRNKFGHYVSQSFLILPSVEMRTTYAHRIQIDLVWFNGLGWYYIVDIESWTGNHSKHTTEVSEHLWPKGAQLEQCAIAAEETVGRLLGRPSIKLNPYELRDGGR